MLAAYLAVYVVLSTAGLLLLRSSLSGHEGDGLLAAVATWRFGAGLLFYGSSFATWMLALRRYELSIVYPIFIGVGYGTVTLAAITLLGEHVTPAKVVGMVLVGLGVVLVGR